MAKKTTQSEEVVPFDVPEETALTTVPQDLLDNKGLGSGGLKKEDIRPARLFIAQKGSPQVLRGDPAEIEGLQEGDLFNSLTGEIYGEKVEIVVITALGSRWDVLIPKKEGGGIKEANISPLDPRCQFGEKEVDGKRVRVPPIATKFLDFLLWLPEHYVVVAWSVKSTALKVGDRLNSIVVQPLKIANKMIINPPTCARLFELSTARQTNIHGNWMTPVLKPKGITPEEIRTLCYAIAQEYAQKNVIIERDDEVEATEHSSDDSDLT